MTEDSGQAQKAGKEFFHDYIKLHIKRLSAQPDY